MKFSELQNYTTTKKPIAIKRNQPKQANGNGKNPVPKQRNFSKIVPKQAMPNWTMPNSYIAKNGLIFRLSIEGELKRVLLLKGTDKFNRIIGLTKIKGAIHRTLEASRLGDKKEFGQALRVLNHHYDSFIIKFGFVNMTANQKAYSGDPDLPTLSAIEKWNERGQVATKTDIFTKPIIDPIQKLPTATSTGIAALHLCLHKFGKVDKTFILKTYPKSEADVLRELEGGIYIDPANGDKWTSAYDYLTGDVRKKLSYARRDPAKYRLNIEALTNILPRPLSSDEIFVQLGSPWVSAKYIMEFVNDEIWGKVEKYQNGDVHIDYLPEVAKWIVDDSQAHYIRANRMDKYTWGTLDKGSMDILSDCLNQKQTICYDRIWNKSIKKWIRKINHQATAAAQNRQERWQRKFKQWIWSNAKRKKELLKVFNTKFNSIVPNDFKPPKHYDKYKFEGMRNTVTLDPHQKGAAYGIVTQKTFGLYHVVGAGKTFTMQTANMESKRLGIIRTGWHNVKNSILFSYAKEFAYLYPGAKILIIQSEDLPKILPATIGFDWDAIIITHHAFKKIKTKQKTRLAHYTDRLNRLQNSIENYTNTSTLHELDTQISSLRKKSSKETIGKSQGLYWEDICEGVALFNDESQVHKMVYFQTKMNVAGVGRGSSKDSIANDMFAKSQYLLKQGFVKFILSTGTPLTNSPSELFTNQRFLQLETLKELGLSHFDAWAAFGCIAKSMLELKPSGKGFHLKTRLSEYDNLTALKRLWFSVCDIKIDRKKLGIKVPTVKNITRVAKPTKEFEDFMASLADRAEALPNDTDIMLNIIHDGTAGSLFLPLVKPELLKRDSNGLIIIHDDSKLGMLCKDTAEVYHATKDKKLTQMLFLDLSTPNRKKEWTVYNIIRDYMIAMYNVTANEIAFAQDYKKDKSKLFTQVNEGQIRIVIGSSETMGVGVNAQRLLYVLRHIDIGYTPKELFQRNGRIERRGNLNEFVEIWRYVTEGGFDAFRWGLVERKIKILLQILDSRLYTHSVKDMEAALISASQVKALTIGDDTILRYADVNATVIRLNGLLGEYRDGINYARVKIDSNKILLNSNIARVNYFDDVINTYKDTIEFAENFGYNLYELCEPHFNKTDFNEVDLGNIYPSVNAVLFVDFFSRQPNIRLQIKGYSSDFKLRIGVDNKETNTAQIKAFFEGKLTNEADKLREINANAIAQINELSPVLKTRFEYSKELAQARGELAEIEKKLSDVKLK